MTTRPELARASQAGAGLAAGLFGAAGLVGGFAGVADLTRLPVGQAALAAGRWFLWTGGRAWPPAPLVAPLIAGGLLATAGAIAGWRLGRVENEQHLAGARMLPRLPPAPGRKKAADGLELAPGMRLSEREETEHFLIPGGSGGGKTTVIMPLARGAAARGDKLLIFDFKRDFTQRFETDAAILGSWDARSWRWMAGEDIATIPAARQFAAAMIPESKDPLWAKAGRAILSGLIFALQADRKLSWSLGDLCATFADAAADQPKIEALLTRFSPETLALLNSEPATRAGFYVNVAAFIAILSDIAVGEMAIPRDRAWSVRRWLADKAPRIAILAWYPPSREMASAFVLPLIEAATVAILSLDEARPERRRIWFFLDEIPQAGRVPSLVQALETGRSKGLRVLIGPQSFAQLDREYGRDGATIIEAQTATKVIVRQRGADDAERAARLGGARRVARYVRGPGGEATWQTSHEPVLEPADLAGLGLGLRGEEEVVWGLVIARDAVVRTFFRFAPDSDPPTGRGFVPAAWLEPGFARPPMGEIGRALESAAGGPGPARRPAGRRPQA